MPKIIEGIELDFSDVLIKPRYTELNSRKDVILERTFISKWNPKLSFTAIPIISANMDSISSWKMCEKLLENHCMVAMSKFITKEDWIKQIEHNSLVIQTSLKNCTLMYSIGIRKDDDGCHTELKQYRELKKLYPNLFNHLCVDVPNGYSKDFIAFIREIRKEFPSIFLTVGNVCTANITKRLIEAGADIVKVGIGSGCFTPNMKIKTSDGDIRIKDIKNGDKVYTHTGELKEVINTITYKCDKEIQVINDIECTKEHEFYVIDKNDKNKINDDNVHKYAKWIEAKYLTTDHLLLELD